MISVEGKTSVIFNLFFCVVLVPLLVFLGPAHSWLRQWPLFFVTVCAFLYASYFILIRVNIPRLIISRDYRRIAAITLGLAAATYLLSCYPLPELDFVTPSLSKFQTRLRDFSVSVSLWLMFTIVCGYALLAAFVQALYGQLLLQRQIERQRDEARLAMFKAQISPHFLFNTLNSLYSLVVGTSEKAEDAFVKFTDILRYTYVTVEKELVPVEEEIAYINNYIELQKLRLNARTTVEWTYTVDEGGVCVPPMLMITFVENAFKYGASTGGDCRIAIELTLSGRLLTFRTRNSIVRHTGEFRRDVPVGLENTRSRLKALFADDYSLSAEERDGDFFVNLTINLDRQCPQATK